MDFNKIKEMGLEYAEKGKNAALDLAEKGRTQAKIVNAQGKLYRAQRQLGACDLESLGDVLRNLIHVGRIHLALSALRHHRTRSEHRAAGRAGVTRRRLTASRIGPGGGCRGENAS